MVKAKKQNDKHSEKRPTELKEREVDQYSILADDGVAQHVGQVVAQKGQMSGQAVSTIGQASGHARIPTGVLVAQIRNALANLSLKENQILLGKVRSVLQAPSMEHANQSEVKVQKAGGAHILPPTSMPHQSVGEPMSFYRDPTAEEIMHLISHLSYFNSDSF